MRLKISEILEDHQLSLEAEPQETFQISDIAEELATSWRDKRQEPNCLQKNRQFGKARYVCRAYRIEVEELKRNTACHKCGKRGHWARECPSKGKSSGKGSTKSHPPSTGAALVEACAAQCDNDDVHFVAMVSSTLTLLDRLRNRAIVPADALSEPPKTEALPSETLLVSSPGFGVLDSGCGRSIIGIKTFRGLDP